MLFLRHASQHQWAGYPYREHWSARLNLVIDPSEPQACTVIAVRLAFYGFGVHWLIACEMFLT